MPQSHIFLIHPIPLISKSQNLPDHPIPTSRNHIIPQYLIINSPNTPIPQIPQSYNTASLGDEWIERTD